MTIVLHLALYLAVAALGWLALLLVAATVIHGREWVWMQTRGAWRHRRRQWFRQERVLGRPVALSRDQPVAFTPRGGWL
jgi:cytochrome bd-type quinol oxidase subunit 2